MPLVLVHSLEIRASMRHRLEAYATRPVHSLAVRVCMLSIQRSQ